MGDTYAIELWDKPTSIFHLNDNHTIQYEKYLKFITDYLKCSLPAVVSQKRLTDKILSEKQDLDYTYNSCIHYLIERMSELTTVQETFNEALMREIDDVARMKINNIKKETKEWRMNRKRISDDLLKENQKIDAHFKRYQSKHAIKLSSHNTYLKAESNKSLSMIQVENHKNCAFLRKREYENEKNDYQQALENFNSYQTDYYSKSLTKWGSQGKQIETDRYDLLQSNFTNLSELCKSLSSKFTEIAEKIEFGLENINLEEDYVTLIGKEKTGDVPPRDIPFRDLDESSMMMNNGVNGNDDECDIYGVVWSGKKSRSSNGKNGSVSQSMTSSQPKPADDESSQVKQADDQSSVGKGSSTKDRLSSSLTNDLPLKPPRTSSIAVSNSGPTESVYQAHSTNSSGSSVTSNPFANGSSRKSSLPSSGIPAVVKKNSTSSNNATTGSGLLGKLFGGIRKSKDTVSSTSLDNNNRNADGSQQNPTEDPGTNDVYADPDDFQEIKETIEVVEEAKEECNADLDTEDASSKSRIKGESMMNNRIPADSVDDSSVIQNRKIEVLRDSAGPVEIVSTPAEAMKSAVRVVSMYSSEYDSLGGVAPAIKDQKPTKSEYSSFTDTPIEDKTSELVSYEYYLVGSCVALHDYSSTDSISIYLSFTVGDQFYIIQEKSDQEQSGWILVERTDKSQIGYVPETYMDRRSFDKPCTMIRVCDADESEVFLQAANYKIK